MKANDCVKLEKSRAFKRGYLKGVKWWKSILMIAPICFLFVGLAGIVHLLNLGQLASWYVIPYLVFFVVGTIWLKAMKKHLQNKAMTDEGAFLVCIASPMTEKDGYISLLFTTGDKRHNDFFAKKLTEELTEDFYSGNELLTSKRRQIVKHSDKHDCDVVLRTMFHNDIAKRNPDWRDGNGFPLLYVNSSKVEVVRKSDLMDLE